MTSKLTRSDEEITVAFGHGGGVKTLLASIANLDLIGPSLRALGRYHHPVQLDPHGKIAAETIPGFDLVPVGELVG